MSLMLSRRNKQYLMGMGIALLVAAGAGIAARSFVDPGALGLSPAIRIAALIALALAAATAVVPWWRSLDEMQRETHLISWYWGGTFGALVGLFSVAALAGLNSDMFRGGALVFAVQFACFVTLLVGWRLIRSGRAS